ncbi:MAG TPA: aminotransferase class V-fold PLP-dependent enzyme [Gaiellaceae bacterium]|nr:aminotransferase class V-fold PLP-dependent enzyme [Gaiellaceae bacterium]
MPTFPVLERVAYLNAGTFGPLAQETADAMAGQARLELEHGRSGEAYFESLLRLRASVRAQIAELLGVGEDRVALTASTTNACHVVLSGLDLAPDDEVVTTDEEHFGLLGPLHVSGAVVRVAPTRALPADEALATILAEVGPRTRLIALSHVSWVTGNVLPVEQIKEETGLPVLVDGAQSAGAIRVDVGAADFYTVSGQKWLCGPDATGALYVRDPESLSVALPTYFSRETHDADGTFSPRAGAARFDTGPVPSPSLAGLDTALRIAPPDRYDAARAVAGRCRELLAEGFEVVTGPGQATLVTFRPRGDAKEAVARLYDAGVVVREIPGTGWVRVSCGYWNTEEHIGRLADTLA